MALTERLALIVSLDANGAISGLNKIGSTADKELGRTESKIDRTAQGFKKAGAGMLAGAALAATGLYKAGQAAADLEQAVGGTEAVFKDTSGVIDKFAKDAAQNMGLSERAFRESTTGLGGQLKGLGFNLDEAADRSINLTKIAADLAATYGGTTADAVSALGSALRGEADPAERFNLFLNQTRVNAKAVELGLAETTNEVSANAKAQATLALITEQSADAQGQFARESGTAAGAQARATAEMENFKASAGQAVAPILATLAGGASDAASAFNSLPDGVQASASKIATIGTIAVGAAGGLSLVVGKALEARDRFSELAASAPRVARGLSLVGKAAGGLAVLSILDTISSQLSEVPTANITKLEQALLDLAKSGKAAGELDLEKLGGAIEKVSAPSVATRLSHTVDAVTSLGGALPFIDDNSTKGLETARQRIEDIDQTLAQLAAKSPKDAKAALDALRDSLGEKDFERLRPLLDDYDTALAGLDVSARTAAGGTDELSAAQDNLNSKLGQTVEDLIAVRTQTIAGFDSQLGYRQSVLDTAEAIDSFTEAKKEHKAGSEEYQQAQIDAEQALLAQAGAAQKAAEDAAKLRGVQDTSAAGASAFRSELQRLVGELAEGSPLRIALQGYIDQLLGVPKTVSTSISYSTSVGGQGRKNVAAGKDAQHRAGGGTVVSGRPYIVGEVGPELFVPNRTGTIAPNDTITGTTGATFNVAVYATTAAKGDALARDLVVELKRHARQNGGDPAVFGR